MKFLMIGILLYFNTAVLSQTTINQTASTQGIDLVEMSFKYPEMIKITTWDKDEIRITGSVMINNGESDDAFKLDISRKDGKLVVTSAIENLESLPKRIMIKRDGEKYYFDTDDFKDKEIQVFLDEKGGGHQYQMHGVIKEIELEIKVPRRVALSIEAKYGLVELSDVPAPVEIVSKYGGIDITLPASSPRNITARIEFGELFSDLDLTLDRSASSSGEYYKWTTVVAALSGGGAKCNLESKYGNLYIRGTN
ncbi:hypothetical protein E1176_12310 [Fulvivirga sp. RKSG066]|uniref:hypothetical protein n=1 Tax=Fulvivirga aurantia TaxID=2529383 RepID=UPI0012BBAC43|nr:hypothetical protein [Fulvivirga aurantia]MTI21806.1 hypothetical protein [Fulvivirga aurantia]